MDWQKGAGWRSNASAGVTLSIQADLTPFREEMGLEGWRLGDSLLFSGMLSNIRSVSYLPAD